MKKEKENSLLTSVGFYGGNFAVDDSLNRHLLRQTTVNNGRFFKKFISYNQMFHAKENL